MKHVVRATNYYSPSPQRQSEEGSRFPAATLAYAGLRRGFLASLTTLRYTSPAFASLFRGELNHAGTFAAASAP